MSNNTKKSTAETMKIRTPEFRASFPALFEPKKVNNQGEAKYSVQMLFQVKETETSKKLGVKVVDITPLMKAVEACAISALGPDKSKWPKMEWPFRKGEEKDYDGYGPGVVFATASTKIKPGIVHAFAGPDGKPAPLTVPTDFYGGCIALATVNPYYWKYMGKQGVSFGLQNVQKLRDCEMFGGRAKAADDFDAIEPPEGASPADAKTGAAAVNGGDPLGMLPS